ncbi:MAG: CoA-binding protein [Balneolaceae bacterium]|nr:CoA-binding protein [Balneolaceae bacterium]MBO6546289.1 CoA-binding protein [Balneolaceae bacterium]MBO6648648.1 CoA-binding protein [Balneolaceae bacterium]
MNTMTPNPQDILRKAKTVAVIGCSPDPYRTSNYAAKYLLKKGYTMIPVNPNEKEILGERCYPDLNSIPEEIQVDVVNVFRRSVHTEGVVKEVEQWKQKTGQNPVIWTQLDVSSPQAELKAEEAELPYVRNLCIMVEMDRM